MQGFVAQQGHLSSWIAQFLFRYLIRNTAHRDQSVESKDFYV
jgi:hypothetical protein